MGEHQFLYTGDYPSIEQGEIGDYIWGGTGPLWEKKNDGEQPVQLTKFDDTGYGGGGATFTLEFYVSPDEGMHVFRFAASLSFACAPEEGSGSGPGEDHRAVWSFSLDEVDYGPHEDHVPDEKEIIVPGVNGQTLEEMIGTFVTDANPGSGSGDPPLYTVEVTVG